MTITCLNCFGKFTAPDGASGKKIQCPHCGYSSVVPSGGSDSPPEVTAVILAAQPVPGPIGATTSFYSETKPPVLRPIGLKKECDFCGEEILAKAKKCKHCGETLDPVLRSVEEAGRRANYQRPSITMIQRNYSRPAYHVVEFDHTIHLVLDILTCGAWFPIHLICWACR